MYMSVRSLGMKNPASPNSFADQQLLTPQVQRMASQGDPRMLCQVSSDQGLSGWQVRKLDSSERGDRSSKEVVRRRVKVSSHLLMRMGTLILGIGDRLIGVVENGAR